MNIYKTKVYQAFCTITGFAIALPTIAALACPPRPSPMQAIRCLPKNITAKDIVSATMVGSGPKGPIVKQVTVQETLVQLKAKCDRKAKLVDAKGKEITFYATPYTSCSGVPPTPEMIKEAKTAYLALEKLKAKYTVIEMTCNPGGIPYP